MKTRYDESFIQAVLDEVERARTKFPDNKHLMTALTEEVGEAAMALLDNHHKGKPAEDVRDELKQVACVALRLATEGDPDFAYDPRQIPWPRPEPEPSGLNVQATVGGDFSMSDISFGPITVLPDGSGCSEGVFPLPKDHWLTKGGYDRPPMPFRIGVSEGRAADHMGPRRGELAEMVRAAGRYAIRASTLNGKSMDFDPDAMLQNLVVGMLGYFSEDGLSMDKGDNPSPVPPKLHSITWMITGEKPK